jgi:hypothetical protein
MANRFTDSRKWDDPWFRKLPCKYKSFFIFLIDKCNHAGIWKIDFESAEFHIGEKLSTEEVIGFMNGRIVQLKDKWFIPKFIEFQYQVSIQDLNPSNRVHKSVIDILTKEGAYKGLIRGVQGCKDYDYDKDKDNVNINNETDKDKTDHDKGTRWETFWALYPRKVGMSLAMAAFARQVKTDKDFKDIMTALKTYLVSDEVKSKKIKNCDRWMEDWRGWLDMAKSPTREIDKYKVEKK